MKAKNNAAENISGQNSESQYPPETAKYLTWNAISFIRSPTSSMLDLTCFILFGTLVVCLLLSRILEIDVTVMGPAEISADGGVKEIVSPIDGLVTHVFKKNGDVVKEKELIARLDMDAATPDDIQRAINNINTLIKKMEQETVALDLVVVPLMLPTSKIYDSVVVQSLVNVEHSIRDFQGDRIRTLALINSKRGSDKNGSEVFYANQRIKFLTKRLHQMQISPQHRLLESYIDSTQEELGRLKAQVGSTQSKASTVLDQAFADLLRSLRIASSALDEYQKHHEIRAPISGVIGKIIDGDNNHVIPNGPIATIIPAGSHYIARIRMKSKDLVRLKKGQKVFYKVEAYPYQRFGLFSGEVIDFDQLKENKTGTATASADADDTFILKATIYAPDNLDQDLRERIKFIVGMGANATVVMNRKSIKDIVIDKMFNLKDSW